MGSKKFKCDFSEKYSNLSKYIEPPKKFKNYSGCIKIFSKHTADKLLLIKDILEEVLNPDIGSLVILYEIKISDINYDGLWDIYRSVVRALRMYDLAILLDDIESYEKFLEFSNKIIDDVIKISRDLIEKKINFWSKKIHYKKPKEYIG